MKTLKLIAASALLAGAAGSFSHETSSHGQHQDHSTHSVQAQQQDWGIAGQSKQVKRSITLRMTDDMRFTPAHFEVRSGETVRLRLENKGKVVHELVLGTTASLQEHAKMMEQNPEMEHEEPHMKHVAAGKKSDLIWHFNRPGNFDFACLIPGHFQAGMRGTFTVTP